MQIFEMISQGILGLILAPFMFIGMVFPISFTFVLIFSYIKIKKKVISEMETNFTIQDRKLLMKKSRQIGFMSLGFQSTLLLIGFTFFMEEIVDFFDSISSSCCTIYDPTMHIALGLIIVFNGFLGFIIAKILIKREIKKYL